MRHATAADLDRLEPLLVRLRTLDGLVERSRGVFTKRGRAFLHCHSDGPDLYVDCRLGETFERYRVNNARERDGLVKRIMASLS